jgi:hypothetical protein
MFGMVNVVLLETITLADTVRIGATGVPEIGNQFKFFTST